MGGPEYGRLPIRRQSAGAHRFPTSHRRFDGAGFVPMGLGQFGTARAVSARATRVRHRRAGRPFALPQRLMKRIDANHQAVQARRGEGPLADGRASRDSRVNEVKGFGRQKGHTELSGCGVRRRFSAQGADFGPRPGRSRLGPVDAIVGEPVPAGSATERSSSRRVEMSCAFARASAGLGGGSELRPTGGMACDRSRRGGVDALEVRGTREDARAVARRDCTDEDRGRP
jgi:hypothetical protein